MTNAKTLVYSLLTTALPSVKVVAAWPDCFNTLPVCCFQIIDNFNRESDYADNKPVQDCLSVKVDLWHRPGESLTPLLDAVNAAFEASNWNRDSCIEMVEPTSKESRATLIYSTVVARI